MGEHTSVTVAVPVVFTGEEDSPGMKKGAVLNIVRHELELVVDAADIPTEIAISVAGKDVGDTIHISDVTLPKGATSAIDDRDFTVATIVAPSALRSEGADTTDEAIEAEVAEAAGETPSED